MAGITTTWQNYEDSQKFNCANNITSLFQPIILSTKIMPEGNYIQSFAIN